MKCLVTSAALVSIHEQLQLRGVDTVAIANEVCINPEILKNPNTFISLEQFSSFLGKASEETKDRVLTWQLGQDFNIEVLGEIGQVLRKFRTLGESLKFLEHSFSILQDWSMVRLEVTDDIATLKYNVFDSSIWPRHYDSEFTLGFFLSIIKYYVPGEPFINKICFDTKANEIGDLLSGGLRCKVKFDSSENKIIFPAHYLDHVLPDTSAHYQMMKGVAELELKIVSLHSQLSFANLVKLEILKRVGNSKIDQSAIASALKLSRRSLRRHLSKEGTSYQEQLDMCRALLAKDALCGSTVPIANIALQLGYSDQSAFSRACVRWFQMSPAAMRSLNQFKKQ